MNRSIILFSHSLNMGGAQHMMLKLANRMAQASLNIHLVVCRGGQGVLSKQLHPSVILTDLHVKNTFSALPGLIRLLRRFQPHAMLSALPNVNLVALWAVRLSGIKTGLVISERSHLSTAIKSNRQLSARLRPRLYRIFYPWADAIVAVSQGVADDLAITARLPRHLIHVIYNPTITPDIEEKANHPLQHPWFAPGMPPVILAVGRLHPPKDYPTLLRAFQHVRAQRDARLLILGEGYLRPELQALATQLGISSDLDMPGFIENPYPYMARAAVFALSSAWEGFPNVLVEAMACGTPVVSTNCPSGPAEILDDGRYGRLAPVGDHASLAQAILASLDHPFSIEQSKLRAGEFSLEYAFAQYCRILEF